MRGAPRSEAHPNYNVGPRPIARARAAVGTHTHPFCFYNFKSQTGCVSSATLFCGNQVSAFVPPLHPTQFFAGPPRVRLLSASCPPQFFAGPPPVRLVSAPVFCVSASCPPRVRPSFLRVRLVSASCPPRANPNRRSSYITD